MRCYPLIILASSAPLSSGRHAFETNDTPMGTSNRSAQVPPSVAGNPNDIITKRLLRDDENTDHEDRMFNKILDKAKGASASVSKVFSAATSKPSGIVERHAEKLKIARTPQVALPLSGPALTRAERLADIRRIKLEEGVLTADDLKNIEVAEDLLSGANFEKLKADLKISRPGKDPESILYGAMRKFFHDDIMASVLRAAEANQDIPRDRLTKMKRERLKKWSKEKMGYLEALNTLKKFEYREDSQLLKDEMVNNFVANAKELEKLIKMRNEGRPTDVILFDTLTDGYGLDALAFNIFKARAHTDFTGEAHDLEKRYFQYLETKNVKPLDLLNGLNMATSDYFEGPKFMLLTRYVQFDKKSTRFVDMDVLALYRKKKSLADLAKMVVETANAENPAQQNNAKYFAQLIFTTYGTSDEQVQRMIKKMVENEAEFWMQLGENIRTNGLDPRLSSPFVPINQMIPPRRRLNT